MPPVISSSSSSGGGGSSGGGSGSSGGGEGSGGSGGSGVVPQLQRNDCRRLRKHIVRLNVRVEELRSGVAAIDATWGNTEGVVDWSLRCHSCGRSAAICATQRVGGLSRCAVRKVGLKQKIKNPPWVKLPKRKKLKSI